MRPPYTELLLCICIDWQIESSAAALVSLVAGQFCVNCSTVSDVASALWGGWVGSKGKQVPRGSLLAMFAQRQRVSRAIVGKTGLEELLQSIRALMRLKEVSSIATQPPIDSCMQEWPSETPSWSIHLSWLSLEFTSAPAIFGLKLLSRGGNDPFHLMKAGLMLDTCNLVEYISDLSSK